tara:strand:- start:552 stop:824 length:273 start_codon:yes stop_codon:yes gene_type:complete
MDDWSDIKLDNNVPLPTDVRNVAKYPWDKFDVGNSYFFSVEEGEDTAKRLKNRLDQSTRTFSKKQEPEWKFTLRVRLENEESGVRVWRVA